MNSAKEFLKAVAAGKTIEELTTGATTPDFTKMTFDELERYFKIFLRLNEEEFRSTDERLTSEEREFLKGLPEAPYNDASSLNFDHLTDKEIDSLIELLSNNGN